MLNVIQEVQGRISGGKVWGTKEWPMQGGETERELAKAWLSAVTRTPSGEVGFWIVGGTAAVWMGDHWAFKGEKDLPGLVLVTMDRVWLEKNKVGRPRAGEEPEKVAVPWSGSMHQVEQVAKALWWMGRLERGRDEFPLWVGKGERDVRTWVRYLDAVVDYRTLKVVEGVTWEFVNPMTVKCKWVEGAKCPRWERFLKEAHGDDTGGADVVETGLGMMHVGGRCAPRKGVVQVGKPRAGKGVASAVGKRLVGAGQMVGMTPVAFTRPHGLEGLDRVCGIVVREAGDAPGGTQKAMAENLKHIWGEDDAPINPKGVKQFFARLSVQVFMQANSVPPIADAKGGVSAKLAMVPYKYSYLGREDVTLEDQLVAELEGIAQRVAAAAHRLLVGQKWPESSGGKEALVEFMVENNPMQAFITEMLEEASGEEKVRIITLRSLWKRWCVWKGVKPKGIAERMVGKRVKEDAPWVVGVRKTDGGAYFLTGLRVKRGAVEAMDRWYVDSNSGGDSPDHG